MKWNAINETIEPKVDDVIFVNTWNGSGCAKLEESDWDGAQFRTTTPNGNNVALNITVTGRTYQWPFGSDSPRCVCIAIEFPDGEGGSSKAKGWLIVNA